ncbi:MAG: tetratricopeptide repeat protein [bacterium]
MRLAITAIILASNSIVFGQQYHSPVTEKVKARQDSIIERYLRHGAWEHSYLTQEWQLCIDSGLAVDSTVAYLWQQKSMPLFKTKKYELGLQALEKAVLYDPYWLDYSGFMKCIFARQYANAISDFNEAYVHHERGSFIMDHPYEFYIGICYLQLNKFDSARQTLQDLLDRDEKTRGRNWSHYLDIFYTGIAYYELRDFDKAIALFDRCLEKNPHFSDAEYYKGLTLELLGDTTGGSALIKKAKEDFDEGYTINEDNAIYEAYPYQVNWKMVRVRE